MKKFIVALMIGMLVSTSAFAWGPREQGILTGAAAVWVIQQLNKAGQPHGHGQPHGDHVIIQHPPVVVQQQPPVVVQQQQQPPVVVQSQPPAPVYRGPQQYCESTQVQDQFGQHRMITFCYFK